MNVTVIFACVGFLVAMFLPSLASAGTRTDIYTVEHPRYGNIGTYIHTIENAGGITHVASQLRLAVSVAGVVLYREDADESEVLRGRSLLSFQSVVNKNGLRTDVRGAVQENGFVVTSPLGTATAPADVSPSDPWSLKRVGVGVVVSTATGEIDNVEVTGGETVAISVHGTLTTSRHFRVRTDSQADKWEVWVDEEGVPIRFRCLEDGTPIDFILAADLPKGTNDLNVAGTPNRSAR